MNHLYKRLIAGAMMGLLLTASVGLAQDADSTETDNSVTIPCYMLLGPIRSPLPAFHDEGKKKVDAGDLLAYKHLSRTGLHPAEGMTVRTVAGTDVTWTEANAGETGVLITTAGEVASDCGVFRAPGCEFRTDNGA